MADWIKMRSSLDLDPRVLTMANHIAKTAPSYILAPSCRDLVGDLPAVSLDVLRDIVVASLLRVWSSANEHTLAGTWKFATLSHLDTISRVPGFGLAMQSVGWAIGDPTTQTVTLPNFMEMNAPSKAEGAGSSRSERNKRYYEKRKLAQQQAKTNQDDLKDDLPSNLISSKSNSVSGTESGIAMDALMKRINAFRPAWTKMAGWGSEDMANLFEQRGNFERLESKDWLLLAWFFKWAASPANPEGKDHVKVTSKRWQLCNELPSYLDRATTTWKQCKCPRLEPATPQTDAPKSTATVDAPLDADTAKAEWAAIRRGEPPPAVAA